MNVQNILLTTDLSNNARRAYRCAASLASKSDATVHLVHFAGEIPYLTPAALRASLLVAMEEALADEASKQTALDGIDVQPHFKKERWTRRLQRTLEEELDIDLIVMSPQGRTGLAKMLLGSFADRMVRHSSAPVLLFRPAGHSDTLAPRTVLVPHDFHDRPQTILPAMRWLDKHFDCAFRFLHVYDPSWSESQTIRELERQFVQATKDSPPLTVEERFAKLQEQDLQGLDATLETAQGIPSVQVVQRANQMPADLVLLSKRDGLGSVARTVVQEVKCSVLTAPIADAEG